MLCFSNAIGYYVFQGYWLYCRILGVLSFVGGGDKPLGCFVINVFGTLGFEVLDCLGIDDLWSLVVVIVGKVGAMGQ